MDPQMILGFLSGTDDDSIIFQISALESLNETLAMSQVGSPPTHVGTVLRASTLFSAREPTSTPPTDGRQRHRWCPVQHCHSSHLYACRVHAAAAGTNDGTRRTTQTTEKAPESVSGACKGPTALVPSTKRQF